MYNSNTNYNNQKMRVKLLNINTISNRIRMMVGTYIHRYGQAYTGVYRFPNAAQIPDWGNYLTILTTTLNRQGQWPVHIWIRNGDDCLLVVCVNGYFRNNMDDITDIVKRLWARRSVGGVPELVQMWRTDPSVIEDVCYGVRGALEELPVIHQRPYRQRGFGCSLLAPAW